jgi:hypothetical protein
MNVKPLFDTTVPLQDAVNRLLQPLVGTFKATVAAIVDNNGQVTEPYSSVVHNDESGAQAVRLDNVAGVIECYDQLTLSVLEDAYRRIKTAKSLQKADRPEVDGAERQMTTGILVARKSDLTLEQISTEVALEIQAVR